MRTLIPLALAALLTVAPVMAQDDETACPEGQVETPEGCSQQAWVDPEDCPPEHLCAAGGPDEPHQYGSEDCIECSGPSDPASDPVSYGPEDCIDCTSAPQDPQTCMDGAQEGESCLDDVLYFGGGPADSEVQPDPGNPSTPQEADSAKDTPALPAALLLVGLAALVLVLRRT